MKKKYSFEDFIGIIAQLRSDTGCPWDKVQTHESLRQAMLEEAYEVVDAIDKEDEKNLCEELGDVLLQVVFHADIEKDQGTFDIGDVIDGITKKMIYRHPHIFGKANVETADKVLENWEELKKREKKHTTQTEVMKSVCDALPALSKAEKVQKKAANVGFDFPETADAMKKVYEECQELQEAMAVENGNVEEELGDLLFSLVNISRFLKINPEFALTKATKKFINRFEYVEKSALSEGKHLSDMTLGELDLLWNKAKNHTDPTEE